MIEKTLSPITFKSVFAQVIEKYIDQKRSLGYKFNVEAESLKHFDLMCESCNIKEPILTNELIERWNRKRPYENDTTHSLRIRHIRSFSIFMHNNGFTAPAAFHPLPHKDRNFIPHIFNDDELQRFFKSVDINNTVVRTVTPIRHLVMPVLFRMIYTCGLRVSEAVLIKNEDVDIERRTVNILNSKGQKDRVIVMSHSMAEICADYRKNPEIINFTSQYFFPAPDHGYYSPDTIYQLFRKYLFDSGIPHGGCGKGPRLHDLRHSFAVHVLSKWQKQGKDIYVCLPILSRYLGHARVEFTETYLRLVSESYQEVTNTFDSTFPDIFPEVPYEEKR